MQRVDFSKINFNYGGAIANSTIESKAPIESWFQFHTSGTMITSNGYLSVKTIGNNGTTEKEIISQSYSSANDMHIFKTTIFSRYLQTGEK